MMEAVKAVCVMIVLVEIFLIVSAVIVFMISEKAWGDRGGTFDEPDECKDCPAAKKYYGEVEKDIDQG